MKKVLKHLVLVVAMGFAIGCAAHQTITGTSTGTISGVTAMSFAPLVPTAPYVPGQLYTLDLSKAVSGGEPPYTFKTCSVSPSWFTVSSAGIASGTPPAGTTGTLNFSFAVVISDTDRATDAPGSGACATSASTIHVSIPSGR